VLTRARLGDDALLAHLLSEKRLADGVVDLVRAGVVQILALEVDVRGAVVLGEALSEIQGVRAPDVVLQDGRELGLRESETLSGDREGGKVSGASASLASRFRR
jgi:hypothetical protein